MEKTPEIVLKSMTTVVERNGNVALRHVTTRGADVRGSEEPEVSYTEFRDLQQASDIAVAMWRLAGRLMTPPSTSETDAAEEPTDADC